MKHALLAAFASVLFSLLPGVAHAEGAADVRFTPSGKLRFIPGRNAMPAAEMLARTGDEDRAWVASEMGGLDYDGITDVYVTLDEVSFIAHQPPNALAPSWASGVAYPQLNRVVLKLGPKEKNPRALLRHELSHISIGRLTGHRAPRWLLEGIAMLHSGDSWAVEGPSLMRATLSGRLFPFQSIARDFPSSPSDAELAYAQSADFTKYLFDRFGEAKLQALLLAMVGGAGFDEAAFTTLGETTIELENAWMRTLNRWQMLFRLGSSYEFIFGVATLLVIIAAWRVRQRKKLRLMLLEREEQAEAMRALLRAPAVWADSPVDDEEEDEVQANAGASAADIEEGDSSDNDDEEEELPEELFARREVPAAKKPTLH